MQDIKISEGNESVTFKREDEIVTFCPVCKFKDNAGFPTLEGPMNKLATCPRCFNVIHICETAVERKCGACAHMVEGYCEIFGGRSKSAIKYCKENLVREWEEKRKQP